LNYFLSKLNIVIQQTKEQEYKIEQFVEICNKYLTSSGDSKSLRFDPSKLEVIVSDDFTGTRISLNDLSSGEKQVISLMAILHLGGDDNKIILIDEPELSLSLKWQKMILPDIDKAKKVDQVVAITHSPFIFDNELEKSATSMKIRRAISDEQ
ncbi:AAA family ATPase, partial [Klebsiella variicola]